MLRLVIALVFTSLFGMIGTPASAESDLAAFVGKADSTYQFTVDPTPQGSDLTTVHMTSQMFKGTAWQHTLLIVKPAALAPQSQALLFIGGGRHDEGEAPAAEVAHLRALAARSQMVVAEIRQVPYQPVFGGLKEDQAISYTLTEFFKTRDRSWPMLQPMVKSVVRAMDTVQAVAKQSWGLAINGFTVTGASKRGWTTWLTAAVDPRVKALVPRVFDIVNIQPQLQHQLASWGTYSEELGDYARKGLPAMLAQPAGQQLLGIIDPFAFRATLVQPKLVVLATNDNYWPVDAANLYFDALTGAKYLLYVPNEGHEIKDDHAVDEDLATLALATAGAFKLPQTRVAFTPPQPGTPALLTLETDAVPAHVSQWEATSPTRDFRSARWRLVAALTPAKRVTLAVTPPAAGCKAAFLEASYNVSGRPWTVTTPVGVVAK